MICINCNSDSIHTDSARGTVYCGECGMVQEEGTIVSTLQFDTSADKAVLQGKNISIENSNIGTGFIDSNFYIKNTISRICTKFNLGNNHAECAFRWYKLCTQHSLSKGKSILYTLSACVYITCRQESTPHLLIDFSNELRIDVFKVGKVFLKLRALLGFDIPLVDPSLFMPRFASQLKFKNRDILTFAIRLVNRMKKDWITTGRRPNNTCGASLVLSSRIYNEERTIEEVAKAVHVTPRIIIKRLQEIAATESAELGIDEFQNIWLDEEEFPPIAKAPSKKKAAVETREIPMQMIFNTPLSPAENPAEEELKDYDEEYDSFNADDMILNEEETKQKQMVWESLYEDFVKEAEQKRKNKHLNPVKKKGKRVGFNTIEEAFKSLDKRVSSKLNYSAIEGIFNSL